MSGWAESKSKKWGVATPAIVFSLLFLLKSLFCGCVQLYHNYAAQCEYEQKAAASGEAMSVYARAARLSRTARWLSNALRAVQHLMPGLVEDGHDHMHAPTVQHHAPQLVSAW
jgi:hypothetical protein